MSKTIIYLYISNKGYSPINDDYIFKITDALKNNTVLQTLDLEINITDLGIKYITDSLKNNNTIKNLGLNFCNISNIGLGYISEVLKNNNTIEGLNILGNDITDLTLLGKALPFNKKLKTIHIGHIPYGNIDNFGKLIQYNTYLTHIEVYDLDERGAVPLNIKNIVFRNIKLNMFEPRLNNNISISNFRNEISIKDKKLFDLIKSVIEFKHNFNKEEEYNKHAIELCFTIEHYYSLLKHNYKKGILGYEKISNPDYLTNPDTNILVLDLHGQIQSKIFQLPSNINLVFLSPVKYITCIATVAFLEELEKPETVKNYLKNPSCYKKSQINNFFKESIIYYGGQYCIDLNISRQKSADNKEVSGLHILDSRTNKITPFKIESDDSLPNLPDLPDLSKDSYYSSLSELLKYLQTSKYEGKQFTIFLTSCREFKLDDYKKKYQNMFSFYENSVKATNFKAQYKDDILDIEKYKLLYNNCKIPPIDFFPYTSKDDITHTQIIKNNNNINKNTIISSSKINITDESKIYNYSNNFLEDLEKYNDANYPEYKYTTLGKLKKFIKTQSRYLKFECMRVILISIYNNCEILDINENYYYKCFTVYNNLVIFILDNDIQLSFECIIYILMYNINKKNIKELYINSFIKNNKSKLNSVLQLNDLNIDKIDFLNLQIDEKLKYKITELYLINNKLNDSFSNDDNSLSLIPELQYLVVENNNITKFPTSILKLKQLQILDLTNNPINDTPSEFPIEFTDKFINDNNVWMLK